VCRISFAPETLLADIDGVYERRGFGESRPASERVVAPTGDHDWSGRI